MSKQPFYFMKSAARRLGVTPQTVHNWMNSGELEYIVTENGRMIPGAVVDEKRDQRVKEVTELLLSMGFNTVVIE